MTQYEREGGWFIHGLTEGKAEGHLGGKRDALLRIAEKRRLTLTDEHRAQIEACTDEAQLDLWIDRALTVETAEALVAEPTS